MAVSRVAAVAPTQRGDVFAFIGAKGGVGNTTLAVNVATALAKTGQTVLVADLNLAYGDAALYLGAEPRFSIVDALDNTARLDYAFLKNIITTTKSRVDLLASADRDPGRPVDFRGLHSLVELCAAHYRYVVLDVPRAGRAGIDPLEKADAIVVVSNHELSAVRSASHLASILRQRYGSARVSVVVSRFDQRSEITSKDIEHAVGEPIRQVFPSDYRVALDALNKGRPLVLDNHTKLATTIGVFARELAKLEPEAPLQEARSSGFLGRLTGGSGKR
jgi:pilus assembly protein CpaE